MTTGTVTVITDWVITLASQTAGDQIKQATLNTSAAMNDVTTGASAGDSESRPGTRTWSVTMDVLNSTGTNEITTLLWTAWSTNASLAISMKADDAATSAANPAYSGTTYVQSFAPISGSHGEPNGASVTLQGTGALAIATS